LGVAGLVVVSPAPGENVESLADLLLATMAAVEE
jgi:hypothetical protein